MTLRLIRSNRVEVLFEVLRQRLFVPGELAFDPRRIVVPSPAMRWWLQLRLADEACGCGIAAGVEWLFLDEVPGCYLESNGERSLRHTSLAVESALRIHAQLWPDVERQLGTGPARDRKLTALSDQLASLFRRYQLHGRGMLREWWEGRDDPIDWQAQLWRFVCNELGVWEQPARVAYGQLHLFAVSWLVPTQLDALQRIAAGIDVTLYQLSPTLHYWSDLCSDRESEWLQRCVERKGASVQVERSLEELLADRNRLLANCGRLGREMATLLIDHEIDGEDYYTLPQALLEREEYRDLLVEESVRGATESAQSLLAALQADILVLRNPTSSTPVAFSVEECSVQIHVASTPLREVEALYDRLLHLVQKGVAPREIIIMAPNISSYAPYLKMVFQELPVRMIDLPWKGESPLVAAFLKLVQLASSRWSVSELMELFECRAFRRATGFSRDRLMTIRRWIELQGVRWGYDGEHIREVLDAPRLVEASVGTWEGGLERLLEEQLLGDGAEIAAADPDLLGDFLQFLRSLREDLDPLQRDEQLLIGDWLDYLHCLLDGYFLLDEEESEEDGAKEMVRSVIESFRVPEVQRLPFASIAERLLSALEAETCSYREWSVDAVRCCSLLPMRAVPAEVVCLLGMSDGNYPRPERDSRHDRLQSHPSREYYPNRSDFDRYLFLEALLSARSYFVMSYSTDCGDGNDAASSLVVRELLDYCDRAFTIDGKVPSSHCVVHHPVSPYDESYFVVGGRQNSYSLSRYRGALAARDPRSTYQMLHAWLSPKQFASVTGVYSVTSLMALSRDPLRFLLRESLGIYLKERPPVGSDQELFVLSPWRRALLRRRAMRRPLDQVIEEADRRGWLPAGSFREVLLQQLQEEMILTTQLLQSEGVELADLFDLELRVDTSRVEQVEPERWVAPALVVDGDRRVTGLLRDLTPVGPLPDIRGTAVDQLRRWPQYLICAILSESDDTPIERCSPLQDDDPQRLLGNYLSYTEGARRAASPLVPAWIESIARGDAVALRKVFLEQRRRFHDPYLCCAFPGNSEPPWELIVDEWHEQLEPLFGSLVGGWS